MNKETKRLTLIHRKIKFWDRCIRSVDRRLDRSKGDIEEINDIINNPPIIAGVRVKIDLVCQLKLSKRCEYLLKQYQIDYSKRQLFIQYKNKWKTERLKIVDKRSVEEIEKGWNDFWGQIKKKRKPKIELDGDGFKKK